MLSILVAGQLQAGADGGRGGGGSAGSGAGGAAGGVAGNGTGGGSAGVGQPGTGGGSAGSGPAGAGGGTAGVGVAGNGAGTAGIGAAGRGGTGNATGGTGGGGGGTTGVAGTGTGGGAAGSGMAGAGGTNPPVMVTLTAAKAGTGAGTVTSNPAGINCGGDCSESVVSGAMLTLTAAADASSTFAGWSGGSCTGTGTCVVTVSAATTVTATFTIKSYALTATLAGTGGGSVASTPAGINCGTTCTANYNHGVMVTLAATPNSTSLFTSWGGACTGSGTCVVTMDQARTVTATFTLQSYGLSVTKAGNGASLGTVSSTPAGVSCGNDCSEAYAANTMVTLTASAATGASFGGWSGGGCTGTGTCTVTINAVVGVTATFTLVQSTLTVSKAGNGTGTVTSNPTGINCGATCATQVDYGGMVTLTASAAAGSAFAGWSGGGCAGNGTCVVTVTAAATVTATFNLTQHQLSITRAGAGGGTVTSSPTGISCGATCAANFNYGTMVTLTAAADSSSDFSGWSGSGCTGTSTCTVTVDQARSVTATFTPKNRTLTVTRTGDGSGTVSVNPGGAVCSATACAYTMPHGTPVSLTAAAGGGSLFEGWAGAGCSTGACTFALTADTTVSATFTLANRTLTVDFTGAATGSVVVMPNGTTLSADGMVTVATHANVTIVATPAANMGFSGWGGPCSGLDDCSFQMEANTTVVARFDPPNKAFITSTEQTPGSLGGFAGADALCAARASSVGLSGTFRAFLGSASGNSPWSRISSARGWARVDGKPFGDSAADLQAGRTFYPLILTETGAEATGSLTGQVFAATAVNNGTAASTCSDWTSTSGGPYDVTFGSPKSGAITYAQNGGLSCNSLMHLYCFEVTRAVRLRPPVPATARRAFLSSGGVTGSITLAGADAQCQTEAAASGLAGNYRALLAGNGTTAASRFSTVGGSAPWYRVDNVQLATTAANFLAAGATPLASLCVRSDGLTHEQAVTWTGALSPSATGTAVSTCSGWGSTTGTTTIDTYSNLLEDDWFGPFSSGNCNQTQRLFCLQQ